MGTSQADKVHRDMGPLGEPCKLDPLPYLIRGRIARGGQRPPTLAHHPTTCPAPPWVTSMSSPVSGCQSSAFDLATAFYQELLWFMGREPRHERTILRLSLTLPEWESDVLRLWSAMERLAQQVAECSGDGAWLVLDFSKTGRPHVYGLALSCEPCSWFQEQWIQLTGASADGCQIKPVTGQKHGWEVTGKSCRRLNSNLARVIHYGLKSLPSGYEVAPVYRVLASGTLSTLWGQAISSTMPASAPAGSEPQNLPRRQCQLCAGYLSPKARSHAIWCSHSCRTLAHRRRERLRKQLDANQRDAFEEHAAILEFDRGMPRLNAEQLAYEHQRQGAWIERSRAQQAEHLRQLIERDALILSGQK